MTQEQPFVAGDFLALGTMMEAYKTSPESNDVHASSVVPTGYAVPSKPQQTSLTGLAETPTAFEKNGTFLGGMDTGVMKHPIWNNATAFEQLLRHKNVREERFVEHTAENVPDRSYPHLLHPMQAWWPGDNVIKYISQVCDNDGPSPFGSSDLVGLKSKYTLSSSLPDADVCRGATHASEKRLHVPGPTDKRDGAALTIFDGGNVNVFNDISVEKAKAIMVLAGGGVSPGSLLGNKFHGNIQASHGFESCQVSANQGVSGNVSMRVDFDRAIVTASGSPSEPVVPRALPQARKASLARFLEKRRERIHLKAPYIMKQADSSLPEERFSSSNDVACYKPCRKIDNEKQMALANWMDQRMSEYMNHGIVKEDTKIVAA